VAIIGSSEPEIVNNMFDIKEVIEAWKVFVSANKSWVKFNT